MRPASSPNLLPVAKLVVELGEPRDFGVTSHGARRFTPILGGTLNVLASRGTDKVDDLTALVLPGGGDRQLVRPDGTVDIDARYDLSTAAGGLIGVRAVGIRRPAADTGVPPYFRVSMTFETSLQEFAFLQESLFVADGKREETSVTHTVYRVG